MQPSGIKIVGRRPPRAAADPAEFRARAQRLQEHADRLNPYPKPRGFVFCARTWADYEAWRTSQPNPRLW
ncbi:MAG: hypothetical protein BWK77_04605 [Verrucomicrobia bacterium A1]|nr:MAG: hypothetical protein BWK77_04605 [Verrucomicrobia bacterium A1]